MNRSCLFEWTILISACSQYFNLILSDPDHAHIRSDGHPTAGHRTQTQTQAHPKLLLDTRTRSDRRLASFTARYDINAALIAWWIRVIVFGVVYSVDIVSKIGYCRRRYARTHEWRR
ncbi:hypothetical protein BDV96DRAFT_570386 [Lophiotrema nucula]|uniref:Uncharacterized protein n=1 Tax=Lophiotrema nucula TaxID=690887 RepID=A0A6A5ZGM7_9PLEO|nr:hypothetical protein BDV96DRAFT_570386 [Lophiotrema nucula]